MRMPPRDFQFGDIVFVDLIERRIFARAIVSGIEAPLTRVLGMKGGRVQCEDR